MYGIIKVGAIDCTKEEELCEEFSVFDVPQLMIFTESYSQDGERFTGTMDMNTIANAAAKKMQNFVSIVSEENFQSFCERDHTKHHVLLFTDKKSTPAIMKALSKQYLNKLIMGEVRASEEKLI